MLVRRTQPSRVSGGSDHAGRTETRGLGRCRVVSLRDARLTRARPFQPCFPTEAHCVSENCTSRTFGSLLWCPWNRQEGALGEVLKPLEIAWADTCLPLTSAPERLLGLPTLEIPMTAPLGAGRPLRSQARPALHVREHFLPSFIEVVTINHKPVLKTTMVDDTAC